MKPSASTGDDEISIVMLQNYLTGFSDALHLRHVQSSYLMGPYLHTKFERNRPSRLRDMEEGCARAHVQIRPTSTLCKINS